MTKKTPYKGPGADSEEKHEPASDIDTAEADSLKVLDPEWPIREADIPSLMAKARCCGDDVMLATAGAVDDDRQGVPPSSVRGSCGGRD